MPAIANPRVKTVESNPATLRSYPNASRIAGSNVGKICLSAAFIEYARHRMTRKTMDNAREYGSAGPAEDLPVATFALGMFIATLLGFRFQVALRSPGPEHRQAATQLSPTRR